MIRKYAAYLLVAGFFVLSPRAGAQERSAEDLCSHVPVPRETILECLSPEKKLQLILYASRGALEAITCGEAWVVLNQIPTGGVKRTAAEAVYTNGSGFHLVVAHGPAKRLRTGMLSVIFPPGKEVKAVMTCVGDPTAR